MMILLLGPLLFFGFSFAFPIEFNLQLICDWPYRGTATVFIMEEDFTGTLFEELDPDDVVTFVKDVPLNQRFTMKGEIVEIGKLEVYLYILYNCGKGEEEVRFDPLLVSRSKRKQDMIIYLSKKTTQSKYLF